MPCIFIAYRQRIFGCQHLDASISGIESHAFCIVHPHALVGAWQALAPPVELHVRLRLPFRALWPLILILSVTFLRHCGC